MSTRESRCQRGRRRARSLTGRLISELRDARIGAGLSQAEMATELDVSQPQIWRIEASQTQGVTLTRLSEMASVLGYELSVGLHPVGDPARDRGQLALGRRLDEILSPRWRVTDEALLPMPGDRRAWDKLLRLTGLDQRYLVGVDLETRIRDIQALVRRTRLRERDGGVDCILILLSDSATNRRLAPELRHSLGESYETSPRGVLAALREGRPLPGPGVVML